MIYALFNHTALYVGKANTQRVGQLGYPSRVWEHIRGIFRLDARESQKPRYRFMRASIGSLCMVPLLWCTTEAQAFALETVVIRTEAPVPNIQDTSAFL